MPDSFAGDPQSCGLPSYRGLNSRSGVVSWANRSAYPQSIKVILSRPACIPIGGFHIAEAKYIGK
jgi:hypothetical protein